jgi:formylglycine-generating enzyme required for sulfatase activity
MRAYTDFRFKSGLPETAWVVLEDMVPMSAGVLPAGAGRPETRVGAFSIARHPVTRAQFQAFVEATGREPSPGEAPGCPVVTDAPAADIKTPMVCVSWTDASAYVTWLNATTGLELRLARVAELQSALRRRDIRAGQAAGISEWTADCMLPPDGGEPGGRPCLERTVLPGSWGEDPATDAGATLDGRQQEFRSNSIGFRLALGS